MTSDLNDNLPHLHEKGIYTAKKIQDYFGQSGGPVNQGCTVIGMQNRYFSIKQDLIVGPKLVSMNPKLLAYMNTFLPGHVKQNH